MCFSRAILLLQCLTSNLHIRARKARKIFFGGDVLKFQDLISITKKKLPLKGNLVVDERTFTIYILCVLRKKFYYISIFLI